MHNYVSKWVHGAESSSRPATQVFPSILLILKVLYHIHKSPPLVLILSNINSVHTLPSYFSKMHFNTTIPWILVVFLSSISYSCAESNGRMIMNGELARVWKKPVAFYFKVGLYPSNCFEGLRQTTRKCNQCNWYHGRESSTEHPECDPWVTTTTTS
jgi:hypothetical protein